MPAEEIPNFNLDAFESERSQKAKETVKPYRVNAHGKVITVNDPHELDWREFINVEENPIRFISLLLNDDDRAHFLSKRTPVVTMNELVSRIQSYYGLGTPGNAGASST
jgi:hypothetical protein